MDEHLQTQDPFRECWKQLYQTSRKDWLSWELEQSYPVPWLSRDQCSILHSQCCASNMTQVSILSALFLHLLETEVQSSMKSNIFSVQSCCLFPCFLGFPRLTLPSLQCKQMIVPSQQCLHFQSEEFQWVQKQTWIWKLLSVDSQQFEEQRRSKRSQQRHQYACKTWIYGWSTLKNYLGSKDTQKEIAQNKGLIRCLNHKNKTMYIYICK